MGRYLVRRLIGIPIVLLILVTISFFMMRSAKGGPFLGEKDIPDEVRANLEAYYGLDKPLPIQYLTYLANLARGDLGPSTKYQNLTVNEIIRAKFAPSMALGLTSLVLAVVFGMAAGILAALKQNSFFDYASMAVAMFGMSLPTFVVGSTFVLFFALHLGWFNVAGWTGPKDMVLPCVALSLPFMARIARLARAGLLEVVHQDYIKTARAKGLPERTIILRHALRGAVLPVVTYLGPATAFIMGGSLVMEQIFNIPGLGQEFVKSAFNRDYSLAMGMVLFYGTILVFANLVVDVLYGFIDPRIQYD